MDPEVQGNARRERLSAEERSHIARIASKKRWAKKRAQETGGELVPLPKAEHWGVLPLLGMDVPCYVLDDGRRVIGRTATTEMLTGIKGGGALEKYLGVSSLKSFIDIDLVLEKMVSFDLQEVEGLGKDVKGLEAEDLIDVARGFVAALEASHRPDSGVKLTGRQTEMAVRATMFLAACAKLGLVAMIDEVTGYQYKRNEDALVVKLAAFPLLR